ncbi:GNAT family N-acetyltransferase [Glaciecola petra]|uniref:GNAT family N-acetyltransferase n=1 Tax=Glaciecola petra TaxID=3075602 RepID=A0ABU2ZPT7_9ALTE|nr:GNAT family N-acetyltransferase [Aestuariibacter sp. P117]MDT0593614.1 GNAT family N-acetyltransferase [Aestuariibacter sp. P117]
MNDYQVEIKSNIDAAEMAALGDDWCSLQSRAKHRFFISWHWMHTWLLTISPHVSIITIRHQGTVVGLCLLCFKDSARHKVMSVKQCFLHETGDPNSDQQWIEYNDFLVDDNHAEYVYPLMVKTLTEAFQWDELLYGVASAEKVRQLADISGLHLVIRWESESHGIDLAKLRNEQPDYLSSLSKNKRSQIRRSIKHYEKQGSIEIHHANTVQEAKTTFAEISPLHRERWGVGYQESGFANPIFCQFHQSLIERNWSSGYIDLIKISCNKRAIAYFYNFIYQNRVYFYLSALQSESDNKLKPGLVGHALCIQQYLDAGIDYYDFMGGGESYKDSLAQRTGKFYRATLQKPIFKLNLEQTLRSAKNTAQTSMKHLASSLQKTKGN